MDGAEDQSSLLSARSISAGPDVVTKLVHRLRALTLNLLPVEVNLNSIKEPTSRIITPEVISAYVASAGDYVEALPFALLHARQTFIWDAQRNIADWDENMGRATACEVLARRIVHNVDPDRLTSVMSTRFRYREHDGDESNPSSALEYAIDKHCPIFLSSSESQDVINSLWSGTWVQKYNEKEDIDYVPFEETRQPGIWGHYDPARISVPRYQNFFRIVIWLFFLLAYSQAVRQPLARLDPHHQSFDEWEYVLYIMTLAFTFEDLYRLYKTISLFAWRAGLFNFWTIVSLVTDGLLVTAFILRIVGLVTDDSSGSKHLHSFQVLSCVSPLIWMKLVTVFDGAKYIGTTQICVARMLQESTIFFALLALLLAGFFQGMIALDASDGVTERGGAVINSLVQALLQAPDFTKSGTNTYNLVLYYFWNFATTVILLNILVSLFASAYSDVVDDAEAQYLAFFAGKTVGMIRAPDKYVYPPPFNLIEMFLVVPWEFFLSRKNYAKLNRYVMVVIFCVPLTVLALFETRLNTKGSYINNWFENNGLGDESSPEAQNPQVEDENGLQISKVEFKDLIKMFPNMRQSSETTILREIQALQRRIDELAEKVDKQN